MTHDAKWHAKLSMTDCQQPTSQHSQKCSVEHITPQLVPFIAHLSLGQSLMQQCDMMQEPSTEQPGLLVCGFSPDGSHIVAGSNDCHIYAWFWDIASAADKGKAAAKQGFYNVVSEQDAARNLETAAAVDLDAVDWPEPQEVCRLGGHVNDVLLLQFSHDGQSIATGSKDGTMRVQACMPAVHHFNHMLLHFQLMERGCINLASYCMQTLQFCCPACLHVHSHAFLVSLSSMGPCTHNNKLVTLVA